ncbi:MAG: DUF2891 domain-containing protein [Acidisphaera sp.]|nr:DUF2891 domain-containing protein [Acidisphaera sp.]
MADGLTPELAAGMAGIALGHVTREYPNKLDHVLRGPEDLRGPRDLHPVFYGSFDWHSCVHGYWLLAFLYRRFAGFTPAPAIRRLLDAHVTPEKVAAEIAYLDQPMRAGFERSYGWAWLLMLAGELARHETTEGRRWSDTLTPLARCFVQRFLDFLPKATYPIRAGTHANSAFALLLALDYTAACGAPELDRLARDTARRWFAGDRDCQAWEPGGDDFLSSALIEAMCMQAALPEPEFAPWFAGFLPRLAEGEPASLFAPVRVSDRSDGKIAHLDGLNLSRAWCWRRLAGALAGEARGRGEAAAERHLAASLPHLDDDYMGGHWLASYAALALAA